MRIAAPAGRIGVLGFSSPPSAIPQQEFTKKELTLYASRLNCSMFPTVIDWVATGRVRPDRIITHHIDFRDVAGAFAVVEGKSERRLQGAAGVPRRRLTVRPRGARPLHPFVSARAAMLE